MAILLQETQRAVFYAPLYAAFSLGAYDDEGVDVRLESGASPDDAARAVLSGRVDVAWGGPMRVLVNHDRQPDCDLVCFTEVVTRDPFFLVGRTARPEFTLCDLIGLQMGIVREVPTPWYCLQEDVRRAGLDPSQLTCNRDRSMEENVSALRRSQVDVIQIFEPFVEELTAEGSGHIWYAAAMRGHTSYTSFYARRSILGQKRAALLAMTRAVYKAQQWVLRSAPEEIASLIAPYFENVPQVRLGGAVTRYKRLGVWGADPYLPESGYNRLEAGLVSGGLIKRGLPFAQGVDNSLAEQAIVSRRTRPPS
jgi:NitT/TauT family transport system substrate-binding protein